MPTVFSFQKSEWIPVAKLRLLLGDRPLRLNSISILLFLIMGICLPLSGQGVDRLIKHVLIYDDALNIEAEEISNIERHQNEANISYVGYGEIIYPELISKVIAPYIGTPFTVDNTMDLEAELESALSESGVHLDVVLPDQSRAQEHLRLLIEGIAILPESSPEPESSTLLPPPPSYEADFLETLSYDSFKNRTVPTSQAPVVQTPAPVYEPVNITPAPQEVQVPSKQEPTINGIVLLGNASLLNNYGDAPDADDVFKAVGLNQIPERFELIRSLRPFIREPLSMDRVNLIKKNIIRHYQNNKRPVVSVSVPRQPVGNGIVQVIVSEGTLSGVKIEGNNWFSDEAIRESLKIRTDGYLDPDAMDDSIRHINQNPFIKLDARFEAGEQQGETAVVVNVKDRFPVRMSAGIDNYANKLTGSERFFAGLGFGNIFGLSRMLNYQYTSDLDFDLLKSHSANYTEFLPWHHTFNIYGGYSEAESIFDDPTLKQEGTSISVGMLYSIPLPDIFSVYRHSVKLGGDFKQSNSSLFFNELDISNTLTDTLQFSLGYEGILQDPFGVTSLTVTGFGAPGGLTNHSKSDVYTLAGYGSTQYAYGKFSLNRSSRLPADWTMLTRISGQIASTSLPSGETLGVGGNLTVRGYDEREANGDIGLIVSNEIRTAPYELPWGAGSLQFLTFVDAASVKKKSIDTNTTNPHVDLLSAGLGFRYAFMDYAVLNFDYGWQFKDSGVSTFTRNPDNHRGHLYFNVNY